MIGQEALVPRKALLLVCESLPRMYYRMFADNLFVNMQTISTCYELKQKTFLCGTARSDYVEFPNILKNHAKAPKNNLDLEEGEYQCMRTIDPPQSVDLVWFEREKNRFISSGADSREAQVFRRKRAEGDVDGHGKKPRLAPQIAYEYNKNMGGVDTADRLRNSRSVVQRARKLYVPLLYWILAAALTDARVLYKKCNPADSSKVNARRKFHLYIVQELCGWKTFQSNQIM